MHLKQLIFLLPFILFAQKKNIAVLQFDAENVSTSEAKILTNRLNDELFNFGKFTVIERAQIEPVLKEQGFQQSGCVSSECAVEAGKLLGVDQIVTGSIGKIGSYYTVSARMIDVQTGEVLKNSTRDISGSIDLILRNTMKVIAGELSGIRVKSTPSSEDKKKDNNAYQAQRTSTIEEEEFTCGQFCVMMIVLFGLIADYYG